MDTRDKALNQFIEELSSKAPAPGGGGASAVCAALGTALGNMVGSLTVGKKKYAGVEEDMKKLMEKADFLQKRFLELADEDEKAFIPLSRCYKMPSDTEEEEASKEAAMEQCLYRAADVPLEIMERCCDAIDVLVKFAEKGSIMAISDAGCGMAMCKAALEAASLNVLINVKYMKDRAEAGNYKAKVYEMMYIYTNKADNIYEMVRSKLMEK